jgi:hypothetical protein
MARWAEMGYCDGRPEKEIKTENNLWASTKHGPKTILGCAEKKKKFSDFDSRNKIHI